MKLPNKAIIIVIVLLLAGGGLYFIGKQDASKPPASINTQTNTSTDSIRENPESEQLTTDEATKEMEQNIFAQLTTLHSQEEVPERGNYPEDYIKAVTVGKNNNGTLEVTVQTKETLSFKITHLLYARLIFKTLFQDKSLNIDKVTTFENVKSTDKYGYANEVLYIKTSLSRSDADKINWDATGYILSGVLSDLATCTGKGCEKF